MAGITLLHGSDHIIKEPKYFLGKPHNDRAIARICRDFVCDRTES